MELTTKVNYIIGEYEENLKPMMEEVTGYADALQELEDLDLMTGFDNLDETSQSLMKLEILSLKNDTLKDIREKLKPIADKIEKKAQELIVKQKTHILEIAENVEDNAELQKLKAQTESLKNTIAGMGAILPGGSPGAALVAAKNAPIIIELIEKEEKTVKKINEAKENIPKVLKAAEELKAFSDTVRKISIK